MKCSELLSLYNLDAYPNFITLLPLMSMDTDLAEIMVVCTEGRLDGFQLHTKSRPSITIATATRGSLDSHKKGDTISVNQNHTLPQNNYVLHAGTTPSNEFLKTATVQASYDHLMRNRQSSNIRYKRGHRPKTKQHNIPLNHIALRIRHSRSCTFSIAPDGDGNGHSRRKLDAHGLQFDANRSRGYDVDCRSVNIYL